MFERAFTLAALAVLAVVLTWRLLGVEATGEVSKVGFWPAFEISIAMPLSWLPLISDYTATAARRGAPETVPPVGCSNPTRSRRSVDLPEPV